MFELSLKFDATGLEKALLASAGPHIVKPAIATALTRIAVGARADVIKQLPAIFDRPTPYTLHSVRYQAATADTLQSNVYISDDSNRGLSPRKYLGPEIRGGSRDIKGSERVLMDAGLMARAQRLVPSTALPLDRFGNVPGSVMVSILSRLKAFGEEGYSANAGAKRKSRLAKMKRATATSGTDYFVARAKRSGEPLGIWRLIGPGRVRPVLIFANRQPSYRERFPLEKIVQEYARKHLGTEVMRALLEQIDRHSR